MNLTVHNAYIYYNINLAENKNKLICRSNNGYTILDIDSNNVYNDYHKYSYTKNDTYMGNTCTTITTNIGIVAKQVGDYIYIFDILAKTNTTFTDIKPAITLSEAKIIYDNVNINSESVYLIDLNHIDGDGFYTEKRNCITMDTTVYYTSPVPLYEDSIHIDNDNAGYYYETATNFDKKIKTFKFPKKDYYIIHILNGSFKSGLTNVDSENMLYIITFDIDSDEFKCEYVTIELGNILNNNTTLIEVI